MGTDRLVLPRGGDNLGRGLGGHDWIVERAHRERRNANVAQDMGRAASIVVVRRAGESMQRGGHGVVELPERPGLDDALFVEVTGTDLPMVVLTLNILAANLASCK